MYTEYVCGVCVCWVHHHHQNNDVWYSVGGKETEIVSGFLVTRYLNFFNLKKIQNTKFFFENQTSKPDDDHQHQHHTIIQKNRFNEFPVSGIDNLFSTWKMGLFFFYNWTGNSSEFLHFDCSIFFLHSPLAVLIRL